MKYHDDDCNEYKGEDHLKEVGPSYHYSCPGGKEGDSLATTHVHKRAAVDLNNLNLLSKCRARLIC